MNTVRLALGGVVAGVVLNACDYVVNNIVLARQWQDLAQRHNLDESSMGGTEALAVFVVIDFLLGFLIAWTYVAIRPRFGPGPPTAAKAGLAVWAVFSLATALFGGWFVPWDLILMSVGIGLVAYLAAALAAGALYAEGSGTALQ